MDRFHLFDLSGKTALITGAGRGIGFALAGGLAEAGAKIILNGRDSAEVERAVETLEKKGHDVTALLFDVSDDRAVSGAIDGYEKQTGSVDIVINNAGMQHRSSLVDFEPEMFDRVLATNTQGVFHVARAAGTRQSIRHHLRTLQFETAMGLAGTQEGYRGTRSRPRPARHQHSYQISCIPIADFDLQDLGIHFSAAKLSCRR